MGSIPIAGAKAVYKDIVDRFFQYFTALTLNLRKEYDYEEIYHPGWHDLFHINEYIAEQLYGGQERALYAFDHHPAFYFPEFIRRNEADGYEKTAFEIM